MHDWKSCIRHKRIWGSNPHLSARYIRGSLFGCRCYTTGKVGRTPSGGVAEWLNAAVSKTVSPVSRVTRVRIPPPPPVKLKPGPPGLFCCPRNRSGFEPMRWNSVKKTCQWHVFRNSPDRACEGGVRIREAKTRIPPPPPVKLKPGMPGLFLLPLQRQRIRTCLLPYS